MNRDFITPTLRAVALAVAYEAASNVVTRLSFAQIAEDVAPRWPSLGDATVDPSMVDAMGAFVRSGDGQIGGETLHRWLGGKGLHGADPATYGDPDHANGGGFMVAHEVFARLLPLLDRVLDDTMATAIAKVEAKHPLRVVPAAALSLPIDETTLEEVDEPGALVNGATRTIADASPATTDKDTGEDDETDGNGEAGGTADLGVVVEGSAAGDAVVAGSGVPDDGAAVAGSERGEADHSAPAPEGVPEPDVREVAPSPAADAAPAAAAAPAQPVKPHRKTRAKR